MSEDTLHMLHIIQAFLLCPVFCSYCYSHEETVTTKKTQGLLVASKGCLEYCCSMALVQTIFYMCSEWAYFQVKSSPFE